LKSAHVPNNACIMMVGSDGKHERHAQSQSEFVLVISSPDNGKIKESVMKTILDNIDGLHPDLRPNGTIEVKVIHSPMPCSYAYNQISRIYPDRYLNSRRIVGNTETHNQIREKVLHEMSDSSDLGRRIRDKMKDQLRDYQKAIDTGIFRGVPNFDPLLGTQYYKESPPIQLGFKSAFIRSVQRKFDIATAQNIRSGKISLSDAVLHLPAATIDKFDYFTFNGCIQQKTATKASEAYAWFLQQYHHIQEHYKNAHQPISLQSKSADFLYYSQIIKEFLKTTLG